MHQLTIAFRGWYSYDTNDALDRALTAAHEYLDDDDVTELERALFGTLRRKGRSLLVDATLPLTADRYFVVAVLGALAWHASEGYVEARRGDRVMDVIVSAGTPH